MTTPWTPPITWIVNQTVTSAALNTYVSDNTMFLYSPPMAKSYKTGNLGITTATWTTAALGTNMYDTDGISNVSTGVFTINTDGVYLISATCQFDVSATNTRRFGLFVNSTSEIAEVGDTAPSSTLPCSLAVSAIHPMGIGDTVEAKVYQNTGSTLQLNGATFPLGYSLAVQWVGQVPS